MAHHHVYNLIEYIKGTENRYLVMDVLEGVARTRTLLPNTPEWFAWLARLPSFHFTGKSGQFSARQERKQRGTKYWYAYLKVRNHRLKRYLGTTETLSLAKLEETARLLHEEALGTVGEDQTLNTRLPKSVTPDGLTAGPLTVLWYDEVLRVTTPTERYLLNRQQAAELLGYLYDQRSSLFKPFR
jgi:hypothetical protein